MRERARAVVIGGGVGGCAILYWLARLGWDDVVLVERAELTSGSTFHSAGLVGQLRSSLSLTRMMMESVELYRSLEQEVGLETGWHEVGSLRLASSEERMEEIARQAGWAKTFGLPLELISPAEAQALFPPMTADGVLGAAFLPTDGYVDPSQLTFALAEGARRQGAEIEQRTRVTDIRVRRGRVEAVETDRGEIETEVVVNAGGMYAREIGMLAGVNVPIVPMAHEYLVTKPAGLPLEMPTMRDPSLLVYFRPESGGLVMGGYERSCAPWGLDGIPADFNSRLLEEDWPRFEELMENAVVRVPGARRDGGGQAHQRSRGLHPRRGVHPRPVRRARLLGRGRASALTGWRARAGWGSSSPSGSSKGHRRSTSGTWTHAASAAPTGASEYTVARTREVYETYYDVKYPGHERQAGRPLRVSPAYMRLVELGAAFGEKSGWERANWFEPNAVRGDESLRPRGWAGKLWSPAIGAEHSACRESAALFDESSFAKIDVIGDGRGRRSWSGCCGNRVAREVGQVTYTQMLNPQGGIECDFTVTRLGDDRFRIVTGTAFGQHDLAWLRAARPGGRLGPASTEVTSQYACYGIWGPKAREILQAADDGRSLERGVPVHACAGARDRPCALPRAPGHLRRRARLGALLSAPSSGSRSGTRSGRRGREHGLVAGGYKAIDSLRLEKGYRVWGSDITPEDTPFEAGLGFAVKLDKGDFRRAATALAQAPEPERVLRCLTLEDPRAVALGSEPVRVEGELVGRVTSGGYGYTVEKSIAYAYVPAEHVVGTPVEVEIFGEWVAGEIAAEPLFDPQGERIRA